MNPASNPTAKPAAKPAASVLIPTKNRKQMLRDTVQSLLSQSVQVEIIIIDDGSTDGTTDFITGVFPPAEFAVRVIRKAHSAGPTVRRNEAAALANADYLFTIDDDCLVPSPRTFEQTLAGFDTPRVGAVTIPFINVRQNQEVRYVAPEATGHHISFQFFGGMVAFRRSAYEQAGGYRTFYFMHVEEPDLSIRLLQAGYVVRLGTADPIHHLESPVRNLKKLHVLGPRNHLLYHWYNTPMPVFLKRISMSAAGTFLHTIKIGRPDLGLWGLLRGLAGVVHERGKRHPVDRRIELLSRQLSRQSRPLSEVEPLLPPLKDSTMTHHPG